MFYSHEVLTSRQYGVATVWLVATLGSKSALKKVSRKAILNVNVTKACETIVEPQAPLALRLQSNLLYGVSRVYLQQCGYVLADAESARMAMRTMLRSAKAAGLDAEGANKARPDQLILEDDPSFLPEFDLISLDLENFDFNRPVDHSQLKMPPSGSSQLITGSQQSIGGLMLPPSNSSFLPAPVGGLDLLSRRGDSGPGKKLDTQWSLEDDIGLLLDDDCIMQDETARQSHAPPGRANRTDLVSDGGDHRLQSDFYTKQPNPGPIDDDGFMVLQDDENQLGQGDAAVGHHGNNATIMEQETTSETAMASFAHRKRNRKVLPLDSETSHSNRVLARWSNEYLEKMREVILSKHGYKLAALAKKNAKHWVLGNGLSLDHGVCGPMEMFTGAALIEAFTGIDPWNRGQKRKRDNADAEVEGSDNLRRVRSRGESSSEEIARDVEDSCFTDGLVQDDGYMPVANDDTIEQGREAPTPLDEQHLSSIFPWNQSASSRQPSDAYSRSTITGGLGGAQLQVFGRRGSRLTSASPLVGRGAPHLEMGDIQLPGSNIYMDDMAGDGEFELFGPAAQVDTQTAAQSQWQRNALRSESANFLSFIQTAIAGQAGVDGDDRVEMTANIDLDTLLPPEDNSQIVAAQAMLHILALGTRNLLRVEQQEAFGPIHLGLIAD